jgi:hypothetical protein
VSSITDMFLDIIHHPVYIYVSCVGTIQGEFVSPVMTSVLIVL